MNHMRENWPISPNDVGMINHFKKVFLRISKFPDEFVFMPVMCFQTRSIQKKLTSVIIKHKGLKVSRRCNFLGEDGKPDFDLFFKKSTNSSRIVCNFVVIKTLIPLII